MPYQSNSNIANLLLRRGDIEANRTRDVSDAWAHATSNIGQIAGSTIQGLMQYKADEPRRKMQELQVQEQERGLKGDRLERDLRARGVDEGTVEKELTGAGYSDVAERMSEKAAQKQDRVLNNAINRIDMSKSAAGRSAAIMNEARQNPALWPQLRGAMVDIVNTADPSMVEMIPQEWNEQQIGELSNSANSIMGELDKRKQGFEMLKLANASTTDRIQAATLQNQYLAQGLSGAHTPEIYDQVTSEARSLGVPEDRIRAVAGDKWTPDTPNQALEKLLPRDKLAAMRFSSGAPEIDPRGTEVNNLYAAKVQALMANPNRRPGPPSAAERSQAFESAMADVYEMKRAATGAGAKEPSPLETSRKQYEDYRADWERADKGEPGAQGKDPLDQETWLYLNHGIGRPTRNYQRVQDWAKQLLDERGLNSGPAEVKAFLDNPNNRRRLGIP